ncbi:meiosis 1 arrest protein isoform X1 [Scleropages formosus]|uniref:Meiosis 1 associated protein n=1 Tax=Scleropages formosus TaxID=113540 RepID=A0A8C9SEG0_SCLFO|nr:meiosis 1 arrest protein isoform X1 [Scleropages formosus]XP_018585828.1 meiosis 1 arrest protein isoform X1 [Scleropages formosus]XP_018585829.1 meiosis 1 arrest protein isoform X1 [Scleropages formosus]
MNVRNRPGSGQLCCPSNFYRQPPRILIVDTSPPWWSHICSSLCEALDNFLTMACSLEGPYRLPLFSLYTVNSHLECLLPFVQVKGNLVRLRSCVEELRSVPWEGCTQLLGGLFKQAVRDSVLQFKQYMHHISVGSQINSSSIEVTILTCRSGQAVVKHLEDGLKDTDLGNLQRLQVIQINLDWSLVGEEPKQSLGRPCSPGLGDLQDSQMLGMEIDLQQVENDSVTLENMFKVWLHEQSGYREHIHLLLPPSLQGCSSDLMSSGRTKPVCLKCDLQERLLSPTLLPGSIDLGAKTETILDFLLPSKGQSAHPHKLVAVRALKSEGVCESVLYGLPLIMKPTSCWQLDWEEMETNLQHFHALCHVLRGRDWFLLVRYEPSLSARAVPSSGPALFSYHLLQPSPSLSLLLKPVAARELLLPCHMPIVSEDPPEGPLARIQVCSPCSPVTLPTFGLGSLYYTLLLSTKKL